MSNQENKQYVVKTTATGDLIVVIRPRYPDLVEVIVKWMEKNKWRILKDDMRGIHESILKLQTYVVCGLLATDAANPNYPVIVDPVTEEKIGQVRLWDSLVDQKVFLENKRFSVIKPGDLIPGVPLAEEIFVKFDGDRNNDTAPKV